MQIKNRIRIKWTVAPVSLPPVLWRCSKCKAQMHFTPSGNFRINAQQHYLDVWMIYRCEKCDTTMNMTIYSRTHPKKIPKEVYELFLQNNKKLAEKYAFDKTILKANNLQAEFSLVEYEVLGEEIACGQPTEVEIICPLTIDWKLEKLLAQKLCLSRQHIKKLCKARAITYSDGAAVSNDKFKTGTTLYITLPEYL